MRADELTPQRGHIAKWVRAGVRGQFRMQGPRWTRTAYLGVVLIGALSKSHVRAFGRELRWGAIGRRGTGLGIYRLGDSVFSTHFARHSAHLQLLKFPPCLDRGVLNDVSGGMPVMEHRAGKP